MGSGGLFVSTKDAVALRIIEDFRAGRVSREKAALLLGKSQRTISRMARRVRDGGVSGIKHGNAGRQPANRIGEAEMSAALELAKGKYRDLNLKHCHELLARDHGLTVSYKSFRLWCNRGGIGQRRKRRPNRVRLWRERMANEGLMLQMDGSHHKWFAGRETCLIATIDDATSEIPAARFFPGETTWACFAVLRQIVETRGVPEILYVDGAGWSGGGPKRQHFSQFVRACSELGIRVIHAHSPQAKGRIERAFRTLQDRLVGELALADVKSMAGANAYLEQVFLPRYWNARLTVEPRETTTRYRAISPHVDLNRVFSYQYDRQVNSAHIVSLNGKVYKINNPELGVLRGKGVVASEDETGKIRWYYGSRELKAELIVPPKRRWKEAG